MVRLLSSRLVRVGFVVAAVAFGVVAVVGEWQDVRQALGRLNGLFLAASVLAVCAGLVAAMLIWRILLADLGSPLRYPVAGRVFFVSQLGKYLPGSVWPVLAQMELGRDHGVPRRRSATAFLLTMLFTLTIGLLVATVTLPFIAAESVRPFRWAFLLTPVFLALLHPRVLNPMIDRVLALTRRPALERPVSLRGVAGAAAASCLQWLFLGVHAWVLVVGVGANAAQSLPLAIGGFALAWCVGYLFVPTPAGIGVREVALAASLAPVLDRADAIVVVLASRVIMTVGDLLVAAAAAATMRGRRPVAGSVR
jgi:uncharacterized membrane protein YbhN (UPF0104 family)